MELGGKMRGNHLEKGREQASGLKPEREKGGRMHGPVSELAKREMAHYDVPEGGIDPVGSVEMTAASSPTLTTEMCLNKIS